jgi:hypothetical protein
MDKALRPERLETIPNSPAATKQFKHWFRTFEYFLEVLPQENLNKLRILINFVVPDVFEIISDCSTYQSAVQALQSAYIKPTNEVYTRHLLATRKQQPGESFDEYLQALKLLAKDCNFQQVSATEYQDESIRNSFIAGIGSQEIRQRLLENSVITLTDMFSKARILETAQKNADSYYQPPTSVTAGVTIKPTSRPTQPTSSSICWNCGNSRHARSVCPARESICHKCSKVGHFAKVCKSSSKPTSAALTSQEQYVGSIFNPMLS